MTTRCWPVAAIVAAGLWAWSAAPKLAQSAALLRRAREATAAGARVVVLPESAAGLWRPTASIFWMDGLRGVGVTVIAGAVIVDRDGYDNAMVEISDGQARELYGERMPVPVSMWQPWRAWTGRGGGAKASFFGNPVVASAGRQLAPLICYEQLLVWPVLQSMLYSPDVIVAIGNDWWTAGTSILAIQKASCEAWARLFALPLVLAFNT